jgi:hypothetical protein
VEKRADPGVELGWSLHRLAVDVDERQFADTIEFAQDIRACLEGVKRAVAVPQPIADEGREVRRIIGFQEQINRNPVAADVAGRIVRHRDGAHLAPCRHDNRHGAGVQNHPTTALPLGSGVELLEPAQRLRRDADQLCRLPLRDALLHQLQGVFERP